MNLFIRIDKGKPASHPVIEENLKMFYPDLDPNNPPEGFERFEKQPYPTLNLNEMIEKVTYEISNYYTDLYNTKTWTDVYHIRTISPEEKQIMIAEFKERNPYVKDWVFDEEKQALVPPVPKPDDGGEYHWIQELNRWIDVREELKNMDVETVKQLVKEIGYELTEENKINLKDTMIDFVINKTFDEIAIYTKESI